MKCYIVDTPEKGDALQQFLNAHPHAAFAAAVDIYHAKPQSPNDTHLSDINVFASLHMDFEGHPALIKRMVLVIEANVGLMRKPVLYVGGVEYDANDYKRVTPKLNFSRIRVPGSDDSQKVECDTCVWLYAITFIHDIDIPNWPED
jgi:hypothetical protein